MAPPTITPAGVIAAAMRSAIFWKIFKSGAKDYVGAAMLDGKSDKALVSFQMFGIQRQTPLEFFPTENGPML